MADLLSHCCALDSEDTEQFDTLLPPRPGTAARSADHSRRDGYKRARNLVFESSRLGCGCLTAGVSLAPRKQSSLKFRFRGQAPGFIPCSGFSTECSVALAPRQQSGSALGAVCIPHFRITRMFHQRTPHARKPALRARIHVRRKISVLPSEQL